MEYERAKQIAETSRAIKASGRARENELAIGRGNEIWPSIAPEEGQEQEQLGE
jgi:hypothetical protein